MDYLPIVWFVIVGSLVVSAAVYRWIRKKKSESWTTVQATLEETRVALHSGRVTYWFVEVAYSYTYEGEFYGGTKSWNCKYEARATGVADKLTKGMKIAVRINPRRPAESFLREDDNSELAAVLAE